jgi:poly(A) polymerase
VDASGTQDTRVRRSGAQVQWEPMARGPDIQARGRKPLPPQEAAEWIIRTLREAGFEALLAGGCVRDMLMGRQPKDYDVATSARPDQLLRIFRRTLKVGVQFGVVMVGDAGPWTEVATFRSDVHYSDGRHPDRVVFSTAEQDALRRDFTVNGLFYDPADQKVIDYVGGQADMRRRVIRAIGRAQERFAEDHLRLLRAVRFSAELDFAIEPKTWRAVVEHAALLEKVSRERVLEELERMLTDPRRAVGMRLLADSGLLAYAIPAAGVGIAWPAEQVNLACARLADLPAQTSFACPLATALADWPVKTVGQLCRQLTCSNDLRRQVVWLVEALPQARRPKDLSLADLKRLMASGYFDDLKHLLHADLAARGEPLDAWQVLGERAAAIPAEKVQPAPLVGGEDLKALGVTPGPIYKQVLDTVYTAQLDEEVAGRDQALAMVRRLLTEAGHKA